jgi:RND family efflux transporter MFP subunit
MTNPVALLTILLSLALLAGCERANEYAPPPPPKVTVALPQVQEVTDYLEFTGTTAASEWAEVRARVSGILLSMHFEPGTWVEQGDLLFVIDPAEYQADLQAAEAELAAAEAQYNRAKIEYSRALKLFKEKAGAEAEVVKWRVERDVASAEILRAKAKVDRAQLNMGYTQVSAPIDGRVGRDQVEIGNLVGESEATVLTEITDSEPMYVYFNLNERDLLRVLDTYRAQLKEQGLEANLERNQEPEIPLYLGLANEQGYPHEGRYDFAESSVDSETGTLQLRGVFQNPGNPPKLLPGLFTRIRMPLGKRPDMPLVAERAIGNDQRGVYVLVVNAENVVERRSVKTGQRIDGLIVIEEGLQADERVVVKGVQRSRPGRAVDPEQVEMASLTTSALREAAQQAEAAARAQPAGGGADNPQPPAAEQ